MKIIPAVVLSLASTLTMAMTPYKQLPSANELRAAVEREGAREVLRSGLWGKDSGDVFDAFVDKVASGEIEWLDLARRFRPVSDAGASEGLDGALSGALLRNPTVVLDLISLSDSASQFSIASICSGRFYLWAEEPPEKARGWYEAAASALSKVTVPELSAKRSACLAVVRQSSHRFEELQRENRVSADPRPE